MSLEEIVVDVDRAEWQAYVRKERSLCDMETNYGEQRHRYFVQRCFQETKYLSEGYILRYLKDIVRGDVWFYLYDHE